METITFYSYKGGVGRTLFVANVANFLAKLGQSVFVIDFDLEAPGLHYKFNLQMHGLCERIGRGLVDYIYSFGSGLGVPKTLREDAIEITSSEQNNGCIRLLPAGDAPSTSYWRHLAQIDWHELFYSEGANGIPFFLELKEEIAREFSPDYLLIDSRTGITEIGGIATTLLPDKVVCLLLRNRENLQGAREVLRSIRRAERLPSQKAIEIIPVVARIPKLDQSDSEEGVLSEVLEYLNEDAPVLADTLRFDEIFILHSEPALEMEESLRIGGTISPAESPLLRDYLRLLTRLISKERIEPHIGPLINEAIDKAINDPDGAQKELEAITSSYPLVETYQALLKFYRLRNVDSTKQLSTAEQFWSVTGLTNDKLVWQAIRKAFGTEAMFTKPGSFPSEFIEAVWKDAGGEDLDTGLRLARLYTVHGQDLRGLAVLQRLLERNENDKTVVIATINQLMRSEQYAPARELIEKYGSTFAADDDFFAVSARLLAAEGNVTDIKATLESEQFSLDRLQRLDPVTTINLLTAAGRQTEVSSILDSFLAPALKRESPRELVSVGEMYQAAGRLPQFADVVQNSLDDDLASEVLRRFGPRWRRPRREPRW